MAIVKTIKLNSFIDNIDCSTNNIFNLAWIIRDSKLRKNVMGKCSNGKDFSELVSELVSDIGNEEPTNNHDAFVVVQRKTRPTKSRKRVTLNMKQDYGYDY